MNTHIDDLMLEAGARFEFLHGVHYDDFCYKTFAKLIVKECLEACSRASEIRSLVPPTRQQSCLDCMREIENTFGVENEQI